MDMDICRCCLISSNTQLYRMDDLIEDTSIGAAFELCTNLPTTTPDLKVKIPQVICEGCLKELHSAYSFSKRCRRSHDLFVRNVIRQIEIKEPDMTMRTAFLIPIEFGEPNQFLVVKAGLNQDQRDDLVEKEIVSTNELESTDQDLVSECDNAEETIDESAKDTGECALDKTVIDKDVLELIPLKDNAKSEGFKCTGCDKCFRSLRCLVKHVEKVHEEQSKLLCRECGKICLDERTFKDHISLHSGKSRYNCETCEKSYQTNSGLVKHTWQCHASEEKKRPARYLCSVCGKRCATHQRLEVHTLTHTGEKNFHCDICGRSFATDFRRRTHRRIHTDERPYQCPMCDMAFKQGNALKCHKRIHTGEKPFECKFCFKRFSQNTILKTHMTLHTGKTIQCDKCEKKFSRRSHLIMHEREHTGEKPYACSECPNRYKQKSHLDRHIDTHMGVKHVCELCGKEYSKRWSLKMHMFVHQDKKPFECDSCDASFYRKDKYRNHLLNSHQITI